MLEQSQKQKDENAALCKKIADMSEEFQTLNLKLEQSEKSLIFLCGFIKVQNRGLESNFFDLF